MLRNTLITIGLSLVGYQVSAQCTGIIFTTSTDTVACGGEIVTIEAEGQGAVTTALGNDFNIGGPGAGWSVSPAGQFNNPCGNGPGGATDPHMWMGSTTAAPRELVTNQLDMSCGGEVCFDFRMAIQGQSSPCEGPDASNEGIYIEWSIDNGATWNTLNYFQPNTSGSFNSQSPGSGDYTGWANYCFTIPPAAETDTTIFHWYQTGSSGTGFDHWGIDNVIISTFSCQSYYYDWDHIAGSPDTNIITPNVTNDSTFNVIFTDGLSDTCSASITIYEDTIVTSTTTPVSPSCETSNDGELTITPTSGDPNYVFDLFGVGTNATGVYTNLAPGWYTYGVLDNNGCYGIDSVEIINGSPIVLTIIDTNATICTGVSTGEVDMQGSGTPTHTYDISGPSSGSNTTGDFTGLPEGNYTATVTDALGCQATATFVIGVNDPFVLNSTGSDETCEGVEDGIIGISSNTGTSPFTYNITGAESASSPVGLFTGLMPGTYFIEVVDDIGCVSYDTVVIDTGVIINGTASSLPTSCSYLSDGSITLTGSNGASPYTYTIMGTSGTQNNSSGVFDPISAGAYVYTITDDNGCEYVDTISVGAPAPVVASFNANPSFGVQPLGVGFINNSSNASSYFWDFMDGNTSTDVNTSHTFGEGVYNVMLIAYDGACSDTAYHIVEVVNNSLIDMPNVFTPGNDGINDVFRVREHRAIETFACSIYDRWGSLMYEFTDINDSWDGTNKNGKPVSDGTYFYTLRAVGYDDVVHELHGHVTVLRKQ